MVLTGKSVAIGFGLTFAAGAATLIGGLFIFSQRLLRWAGRDLYIAASLALAAGVMVYVSLVEIFVQSYDHFKLAGIKHTAAYIYSTLSLFLGFLAVFALEALVHWIDPVHGAESIEAREVHQVAVTQTAENEQAEIAAQQARDGISGAVEIVPSNTSNNKDVESQLPKPKSSVPVMLDVDSEASGLSASERQRLYKAGLMTAIAITIHNFPEGMATFVAALDNPQLGATLAIAIAVHNIPEGLAVAVPTYFATGKQSKAFLFVVVSAVAEPIAAFITWLFLAEYLNNIAFGILFGVVAGMMTLVSFQELLPGARQHDPNDKIVTKFLVLGMGIMAFSLIAFSLT
eukprot:comp18953_c0_seq1/m.21216 comp18953_c0_seq1/g.21216  ORF comp18953_c0_seq1/g.21216 comp18953_c0_seq1/m.21216 type:complete len:345 (-) comp18953_c0_seq1:430-1464(-)